MQINRAADNAAGLAIAEKMRGQINGNDRAAQNVQDGISMLRTAEGAMESSHSVLQRMRELSVQSANGTLTDQDRAAIQQEIGQLKSQLNNNASYTQFNTIHTNDGTLTHSKIQTGPNAGQVLDITIGDISVAAINADINVFSQSDATAAIESLDQSISQLSSERSNIGALENRLQHSYDNNLNASYNLQSAESRNRDADLVKEATLFKQSGVQMYASMMMMSKQMSQMHSRYSFLM